MAKSSFPLITIAVFSLFSLIGFACGEEILYVQGKVYCDTCRIAFEASMTEYIDGAKVRLECRDREGGHLTFSVDGKTDKSGTYRMPVDGDHEEEICEVILVESTRPDCKDIIPSRDRARILITANNGIKDVTRYANSLGFLKKEPLPGCAEALKQIDLLPSAMIP